MTDPRRLLARLNPSTIRYDTLPGGVPELTAQDIAHALGLVPVGLGREVLQACWWPDGAALRRSPCAMRRWPWWCRRFDGSSSACWKRVPMWALSKRAWGGPEQRQAHSRRR